MRGSEDKQTLSFYWRSVYRCFALMPFTFLFLSHKIVFTKTPVQSTFLLVPLCTSQTLNYIPRAAINSPSVCRPHHCYHRSCIPCRRQNTPENSTDSLKIYKTLCLSHCSPSFPFFPPAAPVAPCFSFLEFLPVFVPPFSFHQGILSSVSYCTSLFLSILHIGLFLFWPSSK